MARAELHCGDCRAVLPTLPAGSVDCVITDPPYPEIDRSYGRLTEAAWHALMRSVVRECRRVLKPTGSAVFILQPNSERVGRMRPWLWEFLAWTAREWNQVQDVWWWNYAAMPTVHSQECHGLMRPSLKACVWLGSPDCYRDQGVVLWRESDVSRAKRLSGRLTNDPVIGPSGMRSKPAQIYGKAAERGGVTPFNVLPIANTNSTDSAGSHGHGAGTPADLCDWWLRYICPEGGTVIDPFLGSGTTAVACVELGLDFVGVESDPAYYEIARRRVEAADARYPLFAGA